jgi:RecA-family ATPase
MGGTGKSFFGLALGVTQATGWPVLGELDGEPGPVLYLDWEADEGTHAERLAAITLGADVPEAPAIYYRRMVASLKESAPM